ncbi:30S ribosome-binding factor RbfA [Alicyclobacillus tolerans]|uniref:30S ribosome-binding factor RbfA n=1 Tax=Alicyclobacillus tolerans TaxID=90970 RepID=UPI0027DFD713|nr:30S ribosome-binding factor RbfA [Alicyclobacillus tolerans]MCF8564796.1 30S ribosome-binding factor RbfA [Alicyclobacillus tolerans]
MSRIRAQRVAEQMKKEIAELIRTELKDPGLGFITVTRVELTSDLQHAKVYASVLGDRDAKVHTMDALTRAAGFLRGEVSRRLRMRMTPDMVFKLDESGEYSAHIETVLRKIKSSGDGLSSVQEDVDESAGRGE